MKPALMQISNTANEHLTYCIDGYTTYNAPRNHQGGGTLIYASNKYHHSVIDDISHTNPTYESLFIEVKHKSSTFKIGTVYRPPSTSLRSFNAAFKRNVLAKIKTNKTIICGDFNINLLAQNTLQTRIFITNLKSQII